jgi:predicted nuclease of predicted toxin-antitoxin system
MNILADENIPLMTVARLRELGHDVEDIRRTGKQGLPDPELWALALAEAAQSIAGLGVTIGSAPPTSVYIKVIDIL